MIFNRKSQRLMLAIVLSTLIASAVVAVLSVQYMQERFYNYDDAVFQRLVDKSKTKELKVFFEGITDIINNRDIVIAVNSSGDVIESEGLVLGEGFEEQIHSKLAIEDNRIILRRNQFDLNTYIQNVNVTQDEVFTFKMKDNVIVYYIPFRLVREKDYLMNILTALIVGCFVAGFVLVLLNKDIKELMEEEKHSLELSQADR